MICIVGASLAGDAAAATLRESGYTGRIVLIGDESSAPYDRPPLSKDALADSDDGSDHRWLLRERGWYAEQGIELRLGQAATAIDRAGKTLALADGQTLGYDKLLLTTGARARTLPGATDAPVPGLVVRTLEDASSLRARLSPGARLVVVGAGVIGLEVAATAARRGCQVDVVDLAERVMSRVLPPALSEYIATLHRTNGVRLHLAAGSVAVTERDGQGGVETMAHGFIPADVVVAGIGAMPNTALAEAAGLDCDDGILVDQNCRTSDSAIFAAGDVARFPCAYANRLMRGENWKHAQDHGIAAARSMLGQGEPYAAVQSMWSDQYDTRLQTCGEPRGREVERGSIESGKFMRIYLDEHGVVVGAIGINHAKDMRFAEKLVALRARVDAERLADPKHDLRKLAA